MIISLVIIAIIVILGIFYLTTQNTPSYTAPATPSTNTSSSTIPAQNLPTNPPANINPPATVQTFAVEISGFAFNPKTITINKGDTIKWTNKDSTNHPIISDTGNEIDSGNLVKDATYSHTFNNTGTYNYHCQIHTSMKGTVIVQ